MSTTTETLICIPRQKTAAHETDQARAEYIAQAHDAMWPTIASARQMRERATVFITLVQLVEAQAAVYGITGISLPAADRYRRLGAEDRARRAAEAEARR